MPSDLKKDPTCRKLPIGTSQKTVQRFRARAPLSRRNGSNDVEPHVTTHDGRVELEVTPNPRERRGLWVQDQEYTLRLMKRRIEGRGRDLDRDLLIEFVLAIGIATPSAARFYQALALVEHP